MSDGGQEPVNKTTQWRKHSKREKNLVIYIHVGNFTDISSSILPLACVIKSGCDCGMYSVVHCPILEITYIGVQMFIINNM